MKPFRDLSPEDLFEQDRVRPFLVTAVKRIVEAESAGSHWMFFREYEENSEGIRYEFYGVHVDWVVPTNGISEQFIVPSPASRALLLNLIRQYKHL